jgi:hypothetical protein
MGYYSTIKGSLKISPPISLEDIHAAGLGKHIDSDADTYLVFEDFEDALPGEYLDTISSRWEESLKVYTLIPELKAMVAALADRVYDGYLLVEGEGYGEGEPDIWRLRVRDNQVEEVFPKLVWPED